MQRFVKAELLLQFLNKRGIETLGAAVLAGVITAAVLHDDLAPSGAGDPLGHGVPDTSQVGENLFDRSPGGHLNDEKVDDHNRQQRWNHQQQAANNIRSHVSA